MGSQPPIGVDMNKFYNYYTTMNTVSTTTMDPTSESIKTTVNNTNNKNKKKSNPSSYSRYRSNQKQLQTFLPVITINPPSKTYYFIDFYLYIDYEFTFGSKLI